MSLNHFSGIFQSATSKSYSANTYPLMYRFGRGDEDDWWAMEARWGRNREGHGQRLTDGEFHDEEASARAATAWLKWGHDDTPARTQGSPGGGRTTRYGSSPRRLVTTAMGSSTPTSIPARICSGT